MVCLYLSLTGVYIIDTFIRVWKVYWQRDSKIEVKEGLIKQRELGKRKRYRKKVYNTIPYFNDRPTYKDGWFVSSVPTKNAKLLIAKGWH